MTARNAPANRNAAAAPALGPPTLPTSVALVLKDPIDHQTGKASPSLWAPPRWSIPSEQLEQARAALEHMLKPVGKAGVQAALVPLMLTQQLENLDNLPEGFEPAAYLQQKSAEYSRHLEHFPVDILRAACDAHAKASKFFPAVAELVAYAGPALELRQRQQSRLALLIKGRGQATAEPFKHDPRDVVLKTLIKHAERRGLTEKAAAYRHELDVLEGRAVETPKPAPSVMPDDRDAKRPSAPLPTREQGQAIAEEPPMPTDIPE